MPPHRGSTAGRSTSPGAKWFNRHAVPAIRDATAAAGLRVSATGDDAGTCERQRGASVTAQPASSPAFASLRAAAEILGVPTHFCHCALWQRGRGQIIHASNAPIMSIKIMNIYKHADNMTLSG